MEFVKLLINDNYKVFIVDKNQSNLDEIKDYLEPNNHEYIREDLSLINDIKIPISIPKKVPARITCDFVRPTGFSNK